MLSNNAHQYTRDRSIAEMSISNAALAFDEYGHPFIILKDQSTKRRLAGIEAHKVIRMAKNTCT